MPRLLIVFLLLSLPFSRTIPAHAISETDYPAEFSRRVAPFFSGGVRGSFKGAEGVPIQYTCFTHPRPRGAVVVANGYTEGFYKYAEVAYDLHGAGYSVYLFDHRGQGSSGRILENPRLGYIDKFDYFVADLHQFVAGVVRLHLKKSESLFLLAHSMGGAIGARYLEVHPKVFTAAVLSSPMLGVKLGSWDPGIAKLLLRALEFFVRGQALSLGREEANPANQPFEENELTHSRERYRMARAALSDHPATIIAGATNSWVLRALLGGEAALAGAKAIEVPVLLFSAAEDTFVTPKPQEEFCRALKRCSREEVPGAYHEVLMEVDSIREPALRRLLAFFAEAGAAPGP